MAERRVTIVFDENFSRHLAEFLHRESGLPAVHTRAQGWSGKEDAIWMPMAISAGFVLATNDRNEQTRGITVEGFKSLGARVLLFGPFWDHLPKWQRAKWLVAHYDRIHDLASAMPPGSVTMLGRVWKPKTL